MSDETTTDTLTAALARVQAELPPISKGQTATVQTKAGGTYKYNYANLAKITPEVLPLLARNGLAWVTLPTFDDAGQFILRYALRHTSGQEVAGVYPLPDPSRATPQEIGSALTYARRYALCCVVGVAPDDDDDDAQAASQGAKPPPRRPATRPPQSPEAPASAAQPPAAPASAPDVNMSQAIAQLAPADRREVFHFLDANNAQAHKVPSELVPEVESLIASVGGGA